MNLFLMGNIQHLSYLTSDHCPLLLNTESTNAFTGSKRFHFEAWWTMEESIEQESSTRPLMEKLEGLQVSLKELARTNKRKNEGLKRRLTNELETLLERERDDETMARIFETKIHLNMEINKDEMYWEQKAKANWL
ncbi:reverse transcriptase [Gossypium australe]|uniref:Reverse transcriptase n=1 Tax=Gossypium australe TaxID=47621 RepID=A0A5B6WXF7_9ROSI|nr:reverse transcriptase [Gossypium australe]